MKTNAIEKKAAKKQQNWALPNQRVSRETFLSSIKEAEKGPFITIDKFEQRFEAWKHKKGL